jgi:hypothetical protein
MKAQIGLPYKQPTNKPLQRLCKGNIIIDVHARENGVDIYQKTGDDVPQRLSLTREQAHNFYQLMRNNGFVDA